MNNNGFIKMRQSVQKELDYNVSTNSEPARIQRKLEQLSHLDKNIDSFISKITITSKQKGK
ncbi:MAG: hypothetical protein HOK52_09600 [Candidatus Marinimicrobia bacterium]|jgi:hypothetical protein|nr:hypothetical protein [Candidatus Neomarinimicrobiota bacterium]